MQKNIKVAIITLGCKVNQYESNAIAKKLEDNNITVVTQIVPADYYVVNTCAVTNEGERKSRGILTKIQKVNKSAKIYVCGCSAQNNPSKFSCNSNVKCVLGTSSKQNIADKILEDINSTKTQNQFVDTQISSVYQENGLAKSQRTRVVIKVQEGCNNYCSYCIIPYLRGRERSRSLEDVKKEIEFQSKTAKEIVFAGINLSSYGNDFNDGTSLVDLAKLMLWYKNVRFRFSSLEQDIITEDFLKTLSSMPNFAPHFHLSLQSGANNTLKYMNRKYKAEEYFKKVQLINKYFDTPAITTDIIVGFPTETEEDFEECYNFASKCKFAKMHIFPYSTRSGTVASKMKNIATNVKERCQKLAELDGRMQREFLERCLNKSYEVIVETNKNGYFIGHTENYIKCYIKEDKTIKLNDQIKVKLLSIYQDGVLARQI